MQKTFCIIFLFSLILLFTFFCNVVVEVVVDVVADLCVNNVVHVVVYVVFHAVIDFAAQMVTIYYFDVVFCCLRCCSHNGLFPFLFCNKFYLISRGLLLLLLLLSFVVVVNVILLLMKSLYCCGCTFVLNSKSFRSSPGVSSKTNVVQ